MCQIWLRSDGRVEKGGGTDRQTDKGTLQLYVGEAHLFRYRGTSAVGAFNSTVRGVPRTGGLGYLGKSSWNMRIWTHTDGDDICRLPEQYWSLISVRCNLNVTSPTSNFYIKKSHFPLSWLPLLIIQRIPLV